ncbi:NADP-dependent oxidoreductase [Kribbella shirazensis]|uniref:NADPH:quinone reductase-like Zn-dependent oxidoreductase n=1 Tax=Kribbella shirazensis TaxID=1105143 RepID=A0A7X5VHI6_9ACTN|nr:NADP-dependent oxidoreductase [Kribbella shirazensis]NIK61410.1 NADPH:quinone reductase-like Zn-dependent oxidoreductase [Kribbella shirazensis]
MCQLAITTVITCTFNIVLRYRWVSTESEGADPRMMIRVVQADRKGGIEVLSLRELPAPTIGAGDLLVRTIASTINPVDRNIRLRDLNFPLTFGWDIAGVVVESNVLDFSPGDRVIAMTNPMPKGVGAWADLVALDAGTVAHAPSTASLAEAATIPLAGLTALQAWNMLTLSAGDRVLVTGAAGAIGGFAVQLAVHAGVHVDGLVSRPGHVNAARSLGAGFVTKDPKALPLNTYDAILDSIRLPAMSIVDVRELVKENGQYVVTGKDESNIPGGHAIQVTADRDGLQQLVKMVDAGALQLRIAAHYPLSQIHDAHQHFEAGGVLGKIVIDF